ncbi:MAG: hypothetical protein NXI32_02095 [bacterium]|nr:hypothetical protein [bacterium]
MKTNARIWLLMIVAAYPVAMRAVGAEEFLKVGTGLAVITPDPLLPVSGGMGTPQPATHKLGELTARAVVFEKADVRVALVSLDLLGVPSVLCERIRSGVSEISGENVLISATHTHSAPDVYAFPDGQGGHTGDLNYIDFVCRQATQALREAVANLQPAKLKIATDVAQGKLAYNYYAPDLYDRRMSVIQAVNGRGQAILTLVNYAVHPEVLGAATGALSPDLVGPLCSQIESRGGGMAMFINGAQGGMVTADNRDLSKPSDPLRGYWEDIRSWEECQRIGHEMAEEALRIIARADVQADPQLSCSVREVKFPVESDLMWQVILHSPLKYPHGEDRSITARLNLVRLGNAHMLTIPGEALPNIGFYLKRKMRGEHNLLLGLTNDAFGYILTKVDFQSFPRYDYISRTSLGEMTGEIFIEHAEQMILQSESGRP